MLNKKFITKLLNDNFRRSVILKNYKAIESKSLKLKQYATYVVDKYVNDRDKAFVNAKEANYGYSPLEVLAYVAKDGSIKKAFFEFNIVSHFLKADEHSKAVEVVQCILSEIANESKKDIDSFDIDKIDAHLKKIEHEWEEKQKLKAKEDESAGIETSNGAQHKDSANDEHAEANENQK